MKNRMIQITKRRRNRLESLAIRNIQFGRKTKSIIQSMAKLNRKVGLWAKKIGLEGKEKKSLQTLSTVVEKGLQNSD